MKKNIFNYNKKDMGYFFFGIGVTMFILNLTTIIEFIAFLNMNNMDKIIPVTGFYVSLVSSIILIIYSLFNINFDR